MAKKKSSIKNINEEIINKVTVDTTVINVENDDNEKQVEGVLCEVDNEVDLTTLSMKEIMSYKNGLNSVLKYYTDLCEINRNIDENEYRSALTKLNKLRKYETHIVEVIENKIKKIKL
jgi:hypothetical protein